MGDERKTIGSEVGDPQFRFGSRRASPRFLVGCTLFIFIAVGSVFGYVFGVGGVIFAAILACVSMLLIGFIWPLWWDRVIVDSMEKSDEALAEYYDDQLGGDEGSEVPGRSGTRD